MKMIIPEICTHCGRAIGRDTMATKIYIGTKIVKAEPMTNTEFAGTIRRLGEDDWSTSPGYKVIYRMDT
jgi:hypothetical protein